LRRRLRIDARFAIAGVLALAAALAVMTLTRPVERIPVLVAGAFLPPGIPLDDLPIEERSVEPLEGLVPADQRAELAGRSLSVPLEAGSPILWSMLAPGEAGQADALAVTLEPGNAAQGDLRPGDLVDVYVSDDEGTSRIAAGISVIDADTGGGGFGGSDVAVLLAVDAPLAQQIISAMHTGSIDLVRRAR